MFDEQNRDKKDPLSLDGAWSNETQRFEAIFTPPRDKDGHAIKTDWSGEASPASAPEAKPEPPRNPPKKVTVGGKHAAHAAAAPVSKGAKRRQAEKERLEGMPEHIAKGVRMRKVLLIVLLLLVVVFVAIAVFAGGMMVTQNSQAVQETTQDVAGEVEAEKGKVAEGGRTTGKTQVPDLTGLFGKTQDEAIEYLGCGATVSSTQEINEEGNPVRWKVSLVLTEEPSDSKSGTPTVYLDFDSDGKVINAGYSAATASLGYGALSFSDIVNNEHIIEQTLSEAGVNVEEGAAALPEDASSYQSYASVGTTLVRESCSFGGTGTKADGAEVDWSGVLTYDYTAANASSNLADTVRQVYVYVNSK